MSRRWSAASPFVVLSLLFLFLSSSAGYTIAPLRLFQPLQASPAADSYHHCSAAGASVTVANDSYPAGDIFLTKGQVLMIANRTFTLNGFLNVEGGTLIVRNATLKLNPKYAGFVSGIGQGACVEFTDSNIFLAGDMFFGHDASVLMNYVANATPGSGNATLFVNHSITMPTIWNSGKNVTEDIVDSVIEGRYGFDWASTQLGNMSRTYISNSFVSAITLAFAPGEDVKISNLRPGHIARWNLHQNLTVSNVPYDLTLSNVTLVPNVEGSWAWGAEIGWGINANPGTDVLVINSSLYNLDFGWGNQIAKPVVFTGVPSIAPVNATFFNSTKLVNTVVNGELGVICTSCNPIFVNSGLVITYLYGKSNATYVNSVVGASNVINCDSCVLKFEGDSSWGVPVLLNYTSIPYYRVFPNASFWEDQTGYLLFQNTTARILGNATVNTKNGYKPSPFPAGLVQSKITREFPVSVTNNKGTPLAGAKVELATPIGTGWEWNNLPPGTLLNQTTTGRDGRVDLFVTFDDSNAWKYLALTVSYNGTRVSTDMGMATSTPVRLVVGSAQTTTSTTQQATSTSTGSSTTTGSTTILTTQQTTTTAATTGGGGIPEFPHQLVTISIFAVLIVASYLLFRSRRDPAKPSILHG